MMAGMCANCPGRMHDDHDDIDVRKLRNHSKYSKLQNLQYIYSYISYTIQSIHIYNRLYTSCHLNPWMSFAFR